MVPTFSPRYGKLECVGKPLGSESVEQHLAGRREWNKVALFGVILLSCFPPRGAEGVWHRISCTHTHTRARARRLLACCPAWVNRGTFNQAGICHVPPMTSQGGTSAFPGAGFRPRTIAQQGLGGDIRSQEHSGLG